MSAGCTARRHPCFHAVPITSAARNGAATLRAYTAATSATAALRGRPVATKTRPRVRNVRHSGSDIGIVHQVSSAGAAMLVTATRALSGAVRPNTRTPANATRAASGPTSTRFTQRSRSRLAESPAPGLHASASTAGHPGANFSSGGWPGKLRLR
jgi:hypothetical protein